MKRTFALIIATILTLSSLGCAKISPRDNFSPRLQQDVNNQNGKIDKIENNQNSLKAEVDRFSLINRENSGIQILQGDGGLILIFGLVTIAMIVLYFYKTSNNYQKMAEILANEINESSDEDLKARVMKAAQHTEVESRVCKLIRKK